MIKANDLNYRELRCGNWVMYKGEPIQVTMVGEYGIQSKTANSTINAKFQFDITPIPLTHEVLSKIKGCEMIHDGKYTVAWELAHRERFISIAYSKPDKTWRVTFVSEIILQHPTLHWLQNVIYYNWGKELSITL